MFDDEACGEIFIWWSGTVTDQVVGRLGSLKID